MISFKKNEGEVYSVFAVCLFRGGHLFERGCLFKEIQYIHIKQL